MVDGVVPAREPGPVEAVGVAFLQVARVPFSDQAAVVARGPEGLREGELPFPEVLEVSDVPLVVGEQLVPERRHPRQQAGARRGADRRRGVPTVEARAGRRKSIEMLSAGDRVAVDAEGVGAVLIGEEEDDVAGRGHFPASTNTSPR